MKFTLLTLCVLITLTACQTTQPIAVMQGYFPTTASSEEKWCQDEKHRSFDEDEYFNNFGL